MPLASVPVGLGSNRPTPGTHERNRLSSLRDWIDPARGLRRFEPGTKNQDLVRHLVCVDAANGKVIWDTPVPAEMPEDSYSGFLREHGYASSTPVTDGERIYVFYGKSGALAFDLKGKKLWQTNVGKESSGRRWGSAASPVLHGDLVIINASDESQSIRGLDKKTGKEVWKAEASGLELAFGTPQIVTAKGGRQDLVIGVAGELWGLDPDSGDFIWWSEIGPDGNVCPSVVSSGDIAYIMGGRSPSGSAAVRVGGKDDVTATHRLWTSRSSSYVPSPAVHGGHLYWVDDRGTAHCVSAKTGEEVFSERLQGELSSGSRGRSFYGSVVVADGKVYAVSRASGTFVFAAQPEYKLIAQNRLPSDESDFNGSVAVSDGRLYLRSNRFLYCVAAAGSAGQ